MGIQPRQAFGKLDHLQQVAHRIAVGPGNAVDGVGLHEQRRDPHAGAEARVRILEDHDGVASDAPYLRSAKTGDVLTAVEHTASGRPRQPEGGKAKSRLARARLTHDADDLATVPPPG